MKYNSKIITFSLCLLILAVGLPLLGLANPLYAANGSCDVPRFLDAGGVPVQPYVAGQFKVVIRNAQDSTGSSISNGTATIVLSRYKYDTSGGTVYEQMSANYNGGEWTSSSTTKNLPTQKGEDIYVSFYNSVVDGGNTPVCQKTVTTEKNPNGIPDIGTPGGNDICCSDDSQCSKYRGTVSKCNGDNGECASGKACSGGAIIEAGGDCDSNGTNNACRGGVDGQLRCKGSPAKCVASCASRFSSGQPLADCLVAQYGIDFANLGLPEGCKPDKTLLTHAAEVGFVDNLQLSTSACPLGSQQCSVYINNKALLCFSTSTCDDDSPVQCSINATYSSGTVTAAITSACMPSDKKFTLTLNTGTSLAGLGQDIFQPRDFNGISSGNQVNLTISGVNPPSGTSSTAAVTFQVKDAGGATICSQPYDNFFASGNYNGGDKGSTPTPAPIDYGAQNCPFQPPAAVNCPSSLPTYVCDGLKRAAETRSQDQIDENASCTTCINAGNTWTALGCVTTSVGGVFNSVIRIALGVMGGIVLLRLIYLGYLYQTGDTKKIQEARSGVIATIMGIVVVVFSVVILRVIGVNLLDIVPANFYGTG